MPDGKDHFSQKSKVMDNSNTNNNNKSEVCTVDLCSVTDTSNRNVVLTACLPVYVHSAVAASTFSRSCLFVVVVLPPPPPPPPPPLYDCRCVWASVSQICVISRDVLAATEDDGVL